MVYCQAMVEGLNVVTDSPHIWPPGMILDSKRLSERVMEAFQQYTSMYPKLLEAKTAITLTFTRTP